MYGRSTHSRSKTLGKNLRGFQKTSKRLSEHYSRRDERVAWNCRFRSLAAALVPIVRNRPNSIADIRSEQGGVISIESAGSSTVTVLPGGLATGTSAGESLVSAIQLSTRKKGEGKTWLTT